MKPTTEHPLPTTELGRTGERITRIGLGGMHLSLKGRPPRSEAERVIRRAVELGISFVDTADTYGLDEEDRHHNERLIREALAGLGGARKVLVATKAGMKRPGGSWGRDARPERILRSCDESLQALGVDRIDLFQLHAPDPEVPYEESLGALERLLEQGKIRRVGVSNVSLAQLRTALDRLPVQAVQNRLSPFDTRALDDGVVRECEERGLTFIAYSPLGGSGNVKRLGENEGLRRIADRLRHTPWEVVLGWELALSPAIVPIPGPSRIETLESSVKAATLNLGASDVREVEEAIGTL